MFRSYPASRVAQILLVVCYDLCCLISLSALSCVKRISFRPQSGLVFVPRAFVTLVQRWTRVTKALGTRLNSAHSVSRSLHL